MSTTPMRAPSAARRSAVALPMPDAAPVISATLPSSAATTAGYVAIWKHAVIGGRDDMRIARFTAAVLAVAVVLGGSVAGAAPAAAQAGQCPGGTARASGAGNVCVDRSDRRAVPIAEAVREVEAQNPLHSSVFG